ncbi:hypothetical protein [Stutzerimonas tarimensis]|uniref:Uncharacterized protein n=1 Tax=Stutzerimonas tarimensis TaxID=1507735 RepID=A0ABV7T697_9GAMM
MLLKSYESKSLLCNVSVNGATTQPEVDAFRGDLVLEEGEVADASGRRLPPTAVVKQASVLIRQDKIAMVSGILVSVAHFPLFVERYSSDLAAAPSLLFYVENLTKPVVTEVGGVSAVLYPHAEGAAWNTLMDDLRLDKEDFKGQTAEDKVITMADALADFKPKAESCSFEQALGLVMTHQREHRGPV